MDSFAAIVGLWPTAEQLAADLGVPGVTVRQWRNRDSIPANRWAEVANAAAARGFSGVTAELMARIAQRPRDPGSQAAA